MGVIDTLSAGFNVITKRLWLSVPPVLLDLYLWQGPRLSILPMTRQLASFLRNLPKVSLTGVPPSALAQMVEEIGWGLNLFSLLHNELMGMPSLIAWAASEFGGGGGRNVIEIRSWEGLLGISATLLLLGVLISSIYLALMALAVRRKSLSLREVWQRTWRCWAWVTVWEILLLGLGLFINLAISAAILPVALISQAVARGLLNLLGLVSVGLALWLALNTFFTVQALALQDVSLAGAVWRSFNVVRRNFWGMLGLILLSFIIQLGFGQIWRMLDTVSWQTLLSILGNAYIGSGVTAAMMVFYLDRYRRWREEMAEADRSASETRR
ncbi:MAG: hypothetical protein U9Q78_01425 [Chloroflexota bacterium]|nr:hypothetical protein [Chloroflexota bacterium]